MKKNLLRLFLLLCIFSFAKSSSVFAQAFNSQVICFSGGYGVGTFVTSFLNITNTVLSGSDNVRQTQAGPIYFKVEKGVADHIGFGINFAYLNDKFSTSSQSSYGSGTSATYLYSETRTAYSIMARLNFHFGSNEKFDPYFGFGLGYRTAIWTYSTNDPTNNNPFDIGSQLSFPLAFEATLGAKYLVTPNFGLYFEAGLAKSAVQGGLVFNLPGHGKIESR